MLVSVTVIKDKKVEYHRRRNFQHLRGGRKWGSVLDSLRFQNWPLISDPRSLGCLALDRSIMQSCKIVSLLTRSAEGLTAKKTSLESCFLSYN